MSDQSVGRRSVLRSAGIAAGGVALSGAAVASPAAAHEQQRGREPSGSWRVDVHNDDGSRTDSIISFAAGDVCIVHDISPAGPPFTGTWRAGRHGAFRATVLTGTAGEGPGSSGAVIELRLLGTVTHHHLRGTFTFRVTDAGGAQVATGSGTFAGRRVEA